MPITRSGYATTRRKGSTRAYRKARALTLEHATRCAITGQPPTPNNPLEADHIIPKADGGTDHPNNLRAVLKSENRHRGRGGVPTP